jgi:putative membrane protein
MTIVGIVLVALAALLHIYIFYMESIAWTTPRVRATFGTSEEGALATKELAFNQGFYNLFLAVAALLGIVLYLIGQPAIGLTLMFTGVGCMCAAALVLFCASRSKRRAAITQGTLPLLSFIFLLLGLLLG